jgi:hypothetical protein
MTGRIRLGREQRLEFEPASPRRLDAQVSWSLSSFRAPGS